MLSVNFQHVVQSFFFFQEAAFNILTDLPDKPKQVKRLLTDFGKKISLQSRANSVIRP